MPAEIASFYANISANTDDFKKGLNETKDGMSSLEKTSAALGTAFKASFAIGVAAVAAFGAVIAKSVGAAADMEQGITDIGATMGLTGAETEKLGQHILDLGLDPTLKVSATEASEAIMSLGTAGLSLDQIMGGASESTVLLANATGADFAQAASIATDVMGQFNIKAEDLQGAVNQITGATVASKFSIDDMALAYAQAGGVAGSIGVTFDDFNAAIAAISPSFASGSDAGTSFKTLMQRLVPQTDKAKTAMIELGLSTGDDVVTAFFEANGAMKPMEEIAGNLHTAFSGLSDAQKIEAASTIFGTDSMRAALALAEGGTPIIEKMKAAIGKTDAEEMAATRMNTFKGALEIAQGVIETLTISIGNEFLPVLRPLVERFTELATTYGPQIIAFFGKLANSIAAVISPLYDMTFGSGKLWDNLKAVWDVVVKVSAAIGAAVKPIVDLVAKFVKWQDVAMAAGVVLGGVLLVALGAAAVAIGSLIATIAPFIAAFVAIVAVIALVRNAWERNFMDIQGITKNVWASITGFVGTALDSIAGWLKINTGVWKGDWGKTLDFFLHHSQEAWSNLYDSVVGYVGRMINEVRHNVSVWVDQLEYYIRYYVVNTKMHLEVWAGWVKRYFNEAVDWAIDGLKYLFSWFKPREWYEKGVDIIEGLWDGAKKAWQSFTDWWSGIWRRLTGTVDVKMKIGSPSKVMEEKGMFIGKGLALGMQKSLPMIDDALGDMSMSAAGGNYGSAGGGGSSQPPTSTSRIEELLTILIQELRAKNMTVNVSGGGGGGGSYGDLVSMRSTLRQGA